MNRIKIENENEYTILIKTSEMLDRRPELAAMLVISLSTMVFVILGAVGIYQYNNTVTWEGEYTPQNKLGSFFSGCTCLSGNRNLTIARWTRFQYLVKVGRCSTTFRIGNTQTFRITFELDNRSVEASLQKLDDEGVRYREHKISQKSTDPVCHTLFRPVSRESKIVLLILLLLFTGMGSCTGILYMILLLCAYFSSATFQTGILLVNTVRAVSPYLYDFCIKVRDLTLWLKGKVTELVRKHWTHSHWTNGSWSNGSRTEEENYNLHEFDFHEERATEPLLIGQDEDLQGEDDTVVRMEERKHPPLSEPPSYENAPPLGPIDDDDPQEEE